MAGLCPQGVAEVWDVARLAIIALAAWLALNVAFVALRLWVTSRPHRRPQA